jgi:hypothetical protein
MSIDDNNGDSVYDSGIGFVFGAFSEEFDNIEKNFEHTNEMFLRVSSKIEAIDVALAYSVDLNNRRLSKIEADLERLKSYHLSSVRHLRNKVYFLLSFVALSNLALFYFFG